MQPTLQNQAAPWAPQSQVIWDGQVFIPTIVPLSRILPFLPNQTNGPLSRVWGVIENLSISTNTLRYSLPSVIHWTVSEILKALKSVPRTRCVWHPFFLLNPKTVAQWKKKYMNKDFRDLNANLGSGTNFAVQPYSLLWSHFPCGNTEMTRFHSINLSWQAFFSFFFDLDKF